MLRVRADISKRKGKRIGLKLAHVDAAEVRRPVGAVVSRREIGRRVGVSVTTVRVF